ncbi:obtusifoliol 14-alpha demethylase-like [Oryza brachyantha]|uniref:obtusifoliol 14-alpha demethylase-like n=1 Tax=Oryza brachyantha TaxID=4533 RepID=UPI0003EAD5D2|nr:obtusifoliol 14-alpha demethylase-like [Oryza brachyantha]
MDLARELMVWLAFAPLAIAAAILQKAVTAARRRRRAAISTTTTSKKPPPTPPPPMAPGAPFVGVLPALLARGPLAVIRDLHAAMGSVFTVRLLHRRVTFLVGPEEASHFFRGLESEMSQDEVSRFTVPTFGPGVAFDVDYATRQEQFRFFGDTMKPARLRTYVGLMVHEVEEYFGRWEQSGVVDLKHELEHVVTLIASRCLFGEEVRSKMLGEVPTLLRELNDSMRLVTTVFPYLPIPAHRRRDRARARLGEIFAEIVRSRRSGGGAGAGHRDMLQCLIDARYKDGRATTEAEVAGMLVSALFAGQHTSSSTSTWTGARLLTHPEHLRAAVREQEELVRRQPQAAVDHRALQRMEHLHRCIKETLRLHPPSLMLLRYARRSFTVRTRDGAAEYEVPAGHTVASPMVLHNALPHVYEDAGAFDPGRFAPGREEDRAYGADHAYTAFGGGRHACVGEAFAYMQIKVIWSHLLRNFELELVSPFPETDWYVVMPGPKGKVMVRYKRRKLK